MQLSPGSIALHYYSNVLTTLESYASKPMIVATYKHVIKRRPSLGKALAHPLSTNYSMLTSYRYQYDGEHIECYPSVVTSEQPGING